MRRVKKVFKQCCCASGSPRATEQHFREISSVSKRSTVMRSPAADVSDLQPREIAPAATADLSEESDVQSPNSESTLPQMANQET